MTSIVYKQEQIPEHLRQYFTPVGGGGGVSDVPKRANIHPTLIVKPLSVMAWLLKLVTSPGGIVLDPFAGSGTTLVAAASLGIRAVGIELDPAHVAIARARLANAVAATTPTRNGGVVTAPRRSSKRLPTATLPMFASEVRE